MNVIIVGTPFFGYTKLFEKAFRKKVEKVDAYLFPRRIGVYLKIPIVKKIYEIIFKHYVNTIFNSVLSSINNENTILVLFGVNYFSTNQLTILRNKGIKIISYFIDSIYAHDSFYRAINFSDLVITYNKEENSVLEKENINAVFFPLMYDREQYYKIPDIKKDIDVYFIGSIKERLSSLNEICQSLDPMKLNIIIDGSLKKKKINKSKYPYLLKYYRGKKLSAFEINKMYNRTKLCLNLQPKQASSAFNIRTFEIIGSGAFQITNGNKPLLDTLFGENKLILYCESINEFASKSAVFIKEFDQVNMNKNSFLATQYLDEFSFDQRISKLLYIIN